MQMEDITCCNINVNVFQAASFRRYLSQTFSMVGETWSALMGSRLGREPAESDENILGTSHSTTVQEIAASALSTQAHQVKCFASICESGPLSEMDCIALGCVLSPAVAQFVDAPYLEEISSTLKRVGSCRDRQPCDATREPMPLTQMLRQKANIATRKTQLHDDQNGFSA